MSDFLDDLVSDEQFNENVDQGTMGHIEWLIWQASMTDEEKSRQTKRMLRLESMEDAFAMVKFLQDYQPKLGIHRAPMSQYECVIATRERVDRENFRERPCSQP